MSGINNKIDEIVEFFEDDTSWGRKNVINEILSQMPILKDVWIDEVSLEHHSYLTDLEDFADDFFLALLEKVITAIETFKED